MMSLHRNSFLVLLAAFFIQLTPAQTDSETADATTSGNYRILKCNAGQEGSLASDLQILLPQIWENIQALIVDSNLGILSPHGFETLFHSNDNIAYVQSIFQAIANGSPVPLSTTEGRATNPLLNLGYPTIVCIQPGDPQTAIPYADCEASKGFLAGKADNFVALCPAFWEYPTEATVDKCPRVRQNTLTPNTDALVMNQEAVLVHELAHVYGVIPKASWQEGVFEQYLVRDVSNLDEESALLNAPNYAYYYSGNSTEARSCGTEF